MRNKGIDDLTKKEPKVCPGTEKKIHSYGFIKTMMIILFILTLCCLYFAMMSLGAVNQRHPQHGFNFTKNNWVFWCWLPIPIISILLGYRYKKMGLKCKKNIVGGYIMLVLLLVYGSFCLFPTFERDYSEIDPYRSIVRAELPDSGQLEIQEWDKHFEEDKTEYVVINAYYDKEDVKNLERSIESSSDWIPCNSIKSELKILIPSTVRSDSDAYFSIYNKTTGEYNALPSTTGNYEIYAMKYDKSDKKLEIHRFLIAYTV